MTETAAAITGFVAALRSRQASLNTIKSYAHDLRGFARFAPADLAAVAPVTIQAFLDEGNLSPATRRRRHATLCAFFRWAVRQELQIANPMEKVDAVEVPDRLPRPLAPDVVATVLKAIPTDAIRDRALFTLLYETGMRVGEALGLQVVDVDLATDDEKVRVLGKGGRERTVLLIAAPQSVRLLRRHLRTNGIRSGSVFRGDSRYGGSILPMSYTTALRAWRRYCRAAGIEATIHQLRHSRASLLVRAGVPIGTIRKLLGHRNIQSTLLYVDVAQATLKRDLLAYLRQKRGQE